MAVGGELTIKTGTQPGTPSGATTIWTDSNFMLNILKGNGGSSLLLGTSGCPASTSSSGSVGQIAFSGSFMYVCYAPNTWGRVSLSSW